MAGAIPIPERPPATFPPLVGGEREGLEAWLDFHREVLLRKCAGLTLDQLRTAACPPSNLTLLGLLRHMAEVERGWIRRVVEGTDAKSLWCTSERPDADFDDVPSADPAEALAAFEDELAHARQVMAGVASLDQTFTRRERTYDGRWILVHLIEEYARHNGHADLLRQALDGATGD